MTGIIDAMQVQSVGPTSKTTSRCRYGATVSLDTGAHCSLSGLNRDSAQPQQETISISHQLWLQLLQLLLYTMFIYPTLHHDRTIDEWDNKQLYKYLASRTEFWCIDD